MISLVNFVINLGLLFLGLECVKAAKVPVLSYYSIFSYWLGFFLCHVNPDVFMKCLKIATLFLLLLELQEKPLALGHGEELIKRLLFQKHLLEISNSNPDNECCVS